MACSFALQEILKEKETAFELLFFHVKTLRWAVLDLNQ